MKPLDTLLAGLNSALWLNLFALLALVMPATARPLPRVASFGLCADQMVLMLADRAQIASVSDQASGPLSAFAARARGIPVNRGSAEEVIAAGAKVLIYSDSLGKRSADALAGFGVTAIGLPFADGWAEVDAMTRLVARALDQTARGEALVADMHRRLARLRPAEPRRDWPTVVYYRPDGGGAGAGTFVDASLTAAGFRNLQAEWGPPLWSGVPIEQVVRHPPDLFAVSYFDTSRNALSVLRRNPVLWGHARTRPVLDVPGRYWNCGSPLLVDAVAHLARQRARLMRRRGAAE